MTAVDFSLLQRVTGDNNIGLVNCNMEISASCSRTFVILGNAPDLFRAKDNRECNWARLRTHALESFCIHCDHVTNHRSSTMPKRNRDDDIDIDTRWLPGLQGRNDDELAAVLGHFANKAGITTAMFKKARTELSSFSTTKWSDFATQSVFPLDPSRLRLNSFKTPRYHLPLSFHEAAFENAWRWQDVYREKVETTVRILDLVCQPISGYMHFFL